MKHTKKLMSLFLAVLMLLALGATVAFAAETHTITITNKDDKAHTYEAYQIFAGDYTTNDAGKAVLSNIAWGSGVNANSLLTALKTSNNEFDNCATAAEVADVLLRFDNNSTGLDAIAKVIEANTNGTTSGTCGATVDEKTTISGLADGYYFVKETGTIATGSAASKYMIKVVGENVTTTAKTDVPSVGKTVKEGNNWADEATASIGDTVNFRLVGYVPDMSNFTSYYYQFTDTLSAGLTLDATSFKAYFVAGAEGVTMTSVKESGEVGASGSSIVTGTYTAATSAGTPFSIAYTDLKTITGVSSNGFIVIEYSATLNQNAIIESTGNPNTVTLEYSNNPNNTDSKGTTPPEKVVVFTFDLPINKVDDSEVPQALKGAKFALFKTESVATTAAANPTATGALTDAIQFVATTTTGTYKVADATQTDGVAVIEGNNDGKFIIEGLDAGIYYLVETEAPAGYNRLTTPITVTITKSATDATGIATGTVTVGTGATAASNEVTVVNKSGSTLPETGGVGTTLFYVIGGLLMVGAVILLVVKRRMDADI